MGDFAKIKPLEEKIVMLMEDKQSLNSLRNDIEILYGEDIYDVFKFSYDWYNKTNKTRKCEKPIFVHALRVGYAAITYGLGKDAVKIGLLHDLLEDMKEWYASQGDIDSFEELKQEMKNKFGEKIYSRVESLTYKKKKEDYSGLKIKEVEKKKLEIYRDYIGGLISDNDLTEIYVKLLDRIDNTYTMQSLSYGDIIKNIKKNELIIDEVSFFIEGTKRKDEKVDKLISKLKIFTVAVLYETHTFYSLMSEDRHGSEKKELITLIKHFKEKGYER